MAGLKPERVIALIMGESGSGKSLFVANLRNALIFDTDIGGGIAYADERIKKNGSERIQIGSYMELLEELKQRQNHGQLKNITTLAIDHVSILQQEASIRHNPNSERDFGRANEIATREWRKVRELARNQDFNLIVTAHVKSKWENEKAVGTQADGAKNLEGDMSIVLQLRRGPSYPSVAWVQKWRRDPDDPRGLVPATFPFTMENFAAMAGEGLAAPREPVKLASAEQVSQLERLLEIAKLPDGTAEKWLKKATVETFAEMPSAAIAKCIGYVNELLETAKKGAA